MVVWTLRNVTNAVLSLETMLQMQDANGFIPEEIFWGPQGIVVDALNELEWSSTHFNRITQNPVLAFSLKAMYEATNDTAIILQFLPRLGLRYFSFFSFF